jgi:hypothetical protein
MTISLAFLAPDLVKAAIDGALPHGMGVCSPSRSAAGMVTAAQKLGLTWHAAADSNRSLQTKSSVSGKRKFPGQRQNRENRL